MRAGALPRPVLRRLLLRASTELVYGWLLPRVSRSRAHMLILNGVHAGLLLHGLWRCVRRAQVPCAFHGAGLHEHDDRPVHVRVCECDPHRSATCRIRVRVPVHAGERNYDAAAL